MIFRKKKNAMMVYIYIYRVQYVGLPPTPRNHAAAIPAAPTQADAMSTLSIHRGGNGEELAAASPVPPAPPAPAAVAATTPLFSFSKLSFSFLFIRLRRRRRRHPTVREKYEDVPRVLVPPRVAATPHGDDVLHSHRSDLGSKGVDERRTAESAPRVALTVRAHENVGTRQRL